MGVSPRFCTRQRAVDDFPPENARGKRLAIEAEEALETTVYVGVRKERYLKAYVAVHRGTAPGARGLP